MIKFVTGLPGAGKGYYFVLQMIEELQSSDRHIVTNFAIRLHPWIRKLGKRRSRSEKGLVQYLLDEHGTSFNAENRIHVIDDDDMRNFYLHRPNLAGEFIKLEANYDKSGMLESIEAEAFTKTLPVVYYVDEAWKFWNARHWQNIEKGFQFYNAQHRKAGDDLIIATQHPSQVDKQLRILVQEYHTLVNHKYRKIGVFKQPNVISAIISNEPPEMRSKSLAALPKIIRFDKVGIGGCFDTASGAGVQGTAADIDKSAKGLPSWALPVGVIALGAGLVLSARGFGWFSGKLLTGGLHTAAGRAVTNGAKAMSAPWNPMASLAPKPPPVRPQKAEPAPTVYHGITEDEVYCTGYAQMSSNRWWVILSSGDMISTDSGRIEGIYENGVRVDGKFYRMTPEGWHPKEAEKDMTDGGERVRRR